jgi:penicillin-binding protein 1B
MESVAAPPEESQSPIVPAPPFLKRRVVQIAIAIFFLLMSICAVVFLTFYIRLARMTDRKLSAGPFSDSVNVYSAARAIATGEPGSPAEIAARLRRNGYSTARGNPTGWYNVRPDAIEIFPGRDATPEQEPGVFYFQDGKISRIVSLQDNTTRGEYLLEPQLIANFADRNRERRRLVRYSDIPANLRNAVVSIEDKRFFQHGGLDFFRIIKAAWVDIRQGRKEQGASTLSMQLARGLWLDPDKNWRRKLQELLITLHIEHKLTKEKIFEYYANQVYLGRRGTFSLNGFGEGARALFGKDIGQLEVDEAALLAGIVQRPSYYNPLRYPERARERRNLVLQMMRQNGYLSDSDYRAAVEKPINIQPGHLDGADSQYFLDLVSDELQNRLDDHQDRTHSVYTTLDPELQRAAEDAVRVGLEPVDRLLKKKLGKLAPDQPQVALVAMDPRTGEVKALVGGRSYGDSQLNRAVALRQPGSIFKPFVYAAALDSAVSGGQRVLTAATVVDDSPTAFQFHNQVYEPSNFHQNFMGLVTMRTALIHSLNVATVQVAQMVGYDVVVSMARRAGLNNSIKPTPAVALGAYETTPLEMAGAYTIFANQGQYVGPAMVRLVRSADGSILYNRKPAPRKALDPRVAYLMVSMMQDVLRSGTGAGVRGLGFALPAAGKTGTSRDGWFAGFTTELIAVVWVGFDDGRELTLEGAKSALPIWTEFMKRASKLRDYRDARQFKAPNGIVSLTICSDSGEVAGQYCPNPRPDVFITGSEPAIECGLHSFGRQIANWSTALPVGTILAPRVPSSSAFR